MENEMEKLAATADILKKHIENLSMQIVYLQEQIDEHNRARETLENYLKLQGDELLVNVGADTYLYIRMSEKKRAMISLGSDVVIESSIERAIEMLKSRLKEMEEMHVRLLQESEKAQGQYLAIERRIGEIYKKYQGKTDVQGP